MKYFIVILLVIFGLGLYLNLAYSQIFKFLNAHNPGTPERNMSIIIPALSPSSTNKITYFALGDSLTAGAGASKESESYPYRLAELIASKRDAEVNLNNIGEPGATTLDVLNNQVPKLAGLHPDFITLAIGTNDMHNYMVDEVFQRNFDLIITKLSDTTKNLYIINIPFLAGKNAFWPPYRIFFDWKTKHYNELINKSVADKNIYIIDLYSLTHERAVSEPGYYSPDDFHPSAKTYDYWSKLIYDHLNF